jgi:hypothetical protein
MMENFEKIYSNVESLVENFKETEFEYLKFQIEGKKNNNLELIFQKVVKKIKDSINATSNSK